MDRRAVSQKKPFDPEALMSERADRLQSKLDVLVVFLHERLRLRKESLESLDEDERNIGSLLTAFEDRRKDGRIEASGLESSLIGHQLSAQRERRSQETACWSDLLRLMQQILQVWEASEEAKSRQSVIKQSLPEYRLKPEQDYSSARIARDIQTQGKTKWI